MTQGRRRLRKSTVVALALLAILAGGLAEGYLPHTDDGCAVEIHCLTCRLAQAAVPTLAVAVALGVSLRPLELVPMAQSEALPYAALGAPDSRGPPLS
jgi:hypothetical protein